MEHSAFYEPWGYLCVIGPYAYEMRRLRWGVEGIQHLRYVIFKKRLGVVLKFIGIENHDLCNEETLASLYLTVFPSD